MAAPVVIKKYGNRRLYDTGESKYVTLDELAAKIRGGADLRVVDAQTGEDLTQATLTQLVLETGHAARFLPVQLLTQMIRLSDDALAEFFSRYVTGALDLYLQAKRGMQSIAAYSPLAWMGGMGSPFGAPFQPNPGYGGYPPVQAATPPGEPPPGERSAVDDRSDISAMRRELDELKQVIREGLASRPPGPRERAAPGPTRPRKKRRP
ncbi:MAG: hypothetical protein H0T89_04275 [Deltaproteobacteria bacterium]|nr:hypothetical protein [Deltaproteobacteria bacterium]MDQ3296786.1 hypothetical protein [Myxococcota bacterium]